jgi:hypothetical protein
MDLGVLPRDESEQPTELPLDVVRHLKDVREPSSLDPVIIPTSPGPVPLPNEWISHGLS